MDYEGDYPTGKYTFTRTGEGQLQPTELVVEEPPMAAGTAAPQSARSATKRRPTLL